MSVYNMPAGMTRYCAMCRIEIPPSHMFLCPTCYQTKMMQEQLYKKS